MQCTVGRTAQDWPNGCCQEEGLPPTQTKRLAVPLKSLARAAFRQKLDRLLDANRDTWARADLGPSPQVCPSLGSVLQRPALIGEKHENRHTASETRKPRPGPGLAKLSWRNCWLLPPPWTTDICLSIVSLLSLPPPSTHPPNESLHSLTHPLSRSLPLSHCLTLSH